MSLGFVIVTHGDLGNAMLAVATHIMGKKLGEFISVPVPFADGMVGRGLKSAAPFQDRRQLLEQRLAAAVDEVDTGSGVIIFTDIIGGTAFNISRQIMPKKKVAVIAGVNLPMLLKVPSIKDFKLSEAVRQLVDRSRQAIDSL